MRRSSVPASKHCALIVASAHPSVKALVQQLAQSAEAGALIENLAGFMNALAN